MALMYIAIGIIAFLWLVKKRDNIVNEFRNGEELHVRAIGNFRSPSNRVYVLSMYYVDRDNNLYSRNRSTWELSPRRGHDILKCSNGARDGSGRITNSIYTSGGAKVTIPRNAIEFNKLHTPIEKFIVKPMVKGRKLTLLGVLR